MDMTHTPQSRLILLALFAGLAGCAALGGGGGGDDNLPNRGIVPYVRALSADGETGRFVLESSDPTTLIFVEPHALLTADTQIVLFAEARDLDAGGASVVRCDVEATLTCGTPRTVLDPSAAEWLEGRAGAPSVVLQDGSWLLAFAYGAGAGIGLAWSVDGEDFVLDDEPLLEAAGTYEAGGIDSPSLVQTETGYRLYYEGRDANGAARILVAEGDFGLDFERRGVALNVGLDCRDVAGQPEPCWDAAGVGSPEVRVGTTGAGRRVYRLFYTGVGAAGMDLAFAASWEGFEFERFVFNPVIATAATERQATNLWVDDRYLLFFEERVSNAVRGIAVSINEPDAPTEVF